MIVRMRSVSILIYHQDRQRLLSTLEEVGAVHVCENSQAAASADLLKIDDSLKAARRAVALLRCGVRTARKSVGNDESLSASAIVDRCEELEREYERIDARLQQLAKQKESLEPWGNFDPAALQRLRDAGVQIRFFVAPQKKFAAIHSSLPASEVITVRSGKVYFVVIENGRYGEAIDAEEVSLPEGMLGKVVEEIERLRSERSALDAECVRLAAYLPRLNRWLTTLENDRALECARLSMEEAAAGTVVALSGWVPYDRERAVGAALDAVGAWYRFDDPEPGENAPILLKHNAFTRLFEPIIRLFQIPNYRELDPTPAVAPFYALFFGNCLGDAGYGALIVLAMIFALWKVNNELKRFALFGLVLGLSTVVMGLINSGTIFGLPITNYVSVPAARFLSQFVLIKEGQAITPFSFALLLGVIQINVGMFLNIANRWLFGSLAKTLPAVAKVLIIDGLIVLFLAGYQNVAVLKPLMAPAAMAVGTGVVLMGGAICGGGMEALMGNRIADYILKLYFTVSGAIGDILSYVRLFALGLSSGILGYVINVIASQIMGVRYIGWLAGTMFLLGGHGLNLLLSMLGSFVHPLRLTFVEFYNNMEFKGGGVEYRPLKKLT